MANQTIPAIQIKDSNVGIGTTGPSYKLEVNGLAAASRYILNSVPTSGFEGSLTAIAGDSTYNILAGPANGPTIRARWSGGTVNRYLEFGQTDNAGSYSANVRIVEGNVGIGTTNPLFKTTISADITKDGDLTPGTAQLSLEGITTPGKRMILGYDTNSNGFGFIKAGYYGVAWTVLSLQPDGGNVGIGTTAPNALLHSAGKTLSRTTDSGWGQSAVANPNDGEVGFVWAAGGTGYPGVTSTYTRQWIAGLSPFGTGTDRWSLTNKTLGASAAITVLEAGNFGINNTSPSYKLDVTGDARINTGALGVNIAPSATDGRIDASNDIVAFSSSDLRLKENIKPIENALEKVKSLTGVEFDWKPELKHAHGYEGHDTGVIAQEVQEVMPTAIRTNDTGYLAVRYEKLIGLLIEANKELAARVEELESKFK